MHGSQEEKCADDRVKSAERDFVVAQDSSSAFDAEREAKRKQISEWLQAVQATRHEMPNPVVLYPSPILREKLPSVSLSLGLTKNVSDYLFEMIGTMLLYQGVGLAANQAGYRMRMFVTAMPDDPERIRYFINPTILDKRDWSESHEGCLSLPNMSFTVRRPQSVLVHWTDQNCHEREERFEGLNATIICHEMDHLDGALLVDRCGPASKMKNRIGLTFLEGLYEQRSH